MADCGGVNDRHHPGIGGTGDCGPAAVGGVGFVKKIGREELNYYSDAIEIISKNKTISYDLLVEICKFKPSAIIKAYKIIAPNIKPAINMPDTWQPKIGQILKQGRYIEAIKELRSLTGAGLKDAKEAVDVFRTELGIQS